jgi:hypothetical protein
VEVVVTEPGPLGVVLLGSDCILVALHSHVHSHSTRLTQRFGASVSETAMRPNPRCCALTTWTARLTTGGAVVFLQAALLYTCMDRP